MAFLGKVFEVAGTAGKLIRGGTPTLDDRVTVEVVGQPGSTKQELYYLALAAANGTTRRSRPIALFFNPSFLPTMALLQIEYDAASNWVRCTIHYRYGTLGNTAPFATRDGFYANLAVYRGPQCETVGGKMDFVSAEVPGVPNGAPPGPILPWAGRVIVTGCPTVENPAPVPAITQSPVPTLPKLAGPEIRSPNPKPPGDNRSRGVVFDKGSPGTSDNNCCPKQRELIALVFASLSDPGSRGDMQWPASTPGPLGG